MKKLFVLLLMVASIVACGPKEDPEIAVIGVSLDQSTVTLEVGGTANLSATVQPSNATNKAVSWSTSNQSVATVNNGAVTAVAEGTATITAIAGAKSAICTVTVVKKTVAVTSVVLDQTEVSLEPGETVKLTASVKPDDATDKTVSWTSSDTKVAIVENGVVTAAGEGTATITAKAGGKDATCAVYVNKKVVEVESIELDKTEVDLFPGETVKLTASVKPDDATDKTVSWFTNNETIATVEDGVVTAVAEGTAIITANIGTKDAICFVTVKNPEEERIKTVLKKIYDAMDGPNWKLENQKWDMDRPLWEWRGVKWEDNSLSLTFNGEFGLKGEFPDCFNELPSLVQFWVQDEPGVTGTLPPSFAKLDRLGILLIRRTSITSLPDIFEGMPLWFVEVSSNPLLSGPIPESLGSSDLLMGKDAHLELSDNGYTEDIPQSWVRLGEHLTFYLHRFPGQIPDYFYTAKDAAYLINLYINEGYNPDGYRKTNPFVVMDRDIPGYWPDKEIKDVITGEPIHYKEIVSKNKATVILKWASWCGFSMALMPQLKIMYEKYHDAGFEIIARTVWGDDNEIKTQKDFLLKNGYDVWYNFSSDDLFFYEAFALGEQGTPFVNVIDSEGNIIFSCNDYVNDPSRGRYNHVASNDLIPFLEDIFGPLEEGEIYSSTDYSHDGEVFPLQLASVGKGINIVFMGDAYTDKDMEDGSYTNLMFRAMEEFFKIEPYKTFRDRFNVYGVKVVSKNGRTGDGYSTALGAKAYGTTISVSQAGEDKCFEYALKVPGITDKKNLLICVMVNSSGSRGLTSMIESLRSGVAWCASGSNVTEAFGSVIRHEAGGHGFAFLADEYSTDNGTISQELKDEYNRLYKQYGMFANVDFTDDPTKVKWSAFLSDDRYKDEVGIYEGAGGPFSKGIYRPSEDSMMNHNSEYYNAPSRWAIYKRIMELSGETASFELFLEYDAVNRGKKRSSAPVTRSVVEWEPDAPPVLRP